jgi:DNA-binding MarR family transcriptional regulator
VSPSDLPAVVGELPSWLVTQTALYADRLVSAGFGRLQAHRYDYRVLATLRDAGPMSQADLGRRCGIHLSDLVATLNALAEAGHVRRTPDAADRRRNVVTLTPAGRGQLRRLEREVARIQDDLLAPLSAAEREQLTRLLVRLLEHHREKQSTVEHSTVD